MRAMKTFAKKKEHVNAPAGPFTTFSHCVYGYNIRKELVYSRRDAEGAENQYDDLDRLSSDGGVSYTYDAAGNRTTIDNLLAVKVGGASYYPLTDIQGTVWGYIDSQNNVVARWQYDAWGNVVEEEISSTATALASLRYRFQCRECSAATGPTKPAYAGVEGFVGAGSAPLICK